LRTTGYGLGFPIARRGPLPLRFAGFATLGFVFEILIVEEVLLSGCEYKLRSAVDALEDAILELRHSTCALIDLNLPLQPELVSNGRMAGIDARHRTLLYIPAWFLPVSFAGQRLLGPALLAWLQIEGVTFDLFDNVFLLNLSFEAAQGVF
jgi:hypothetical protein